MEIEATLVQCLSYVSRTQTELFGVALSVALKNIGRGGSNEKKRKENSFSNHKYKRN